MGSENPTRSALDVIEPPSEPKPLCQVVGEVVDDLGNLIAVEGVEISLLPDGETRTIQTSQGIFEAQLDVGLHSIRVSDSFIPPEYLPQIQVSASQILGYEDTTGLLPPTINITAVDTSRSIQVILQRPCTVGGRIVDADHQPIERAFIRLQSYAKGMQQLHADIQTSSDGTFRFEKIRPGASYDLLIWTGESPTEAHRKLPRPLPLPIATFPSQNHALGDIVVGAGPLTLTGTVLDQDGSPFSNLLVSCYSTASHPETGRSYGWRGEFMTAKTDAEGRFTMPGTPATELAIQLAKDFEPNVPLGQRQTAFYAEPVLENATGKNGIIDIGIHQVDRSRPFQVNFQLKSETENISPVGCTVKVELLDPTQNWEPRQLRRPSFQSRKWRIKKENQIIQWTCETPHPQVIFKVLRNNKTISTWITTPTPNGTLNPIHPINQSTP